MRLVEAAIAGVVAAVVTLIVLARFHLEVDRAASAAVMFLVAFLAVILRPSYRDEYTAGRR